MPASIKTQIYAAPATYTAVGTPNYNANLPLIIIPIQFSTEFPRNVTVTTEVIRENFFTTGTGSIRDYFSENSWGQFNIREGWTSGDDWLPERLLNESLPTGIARGVALSATELREMIQAYYSARGWDQAGLISEEKLSVLGLKRVPQTPVRN